MRDHVLTVLVSDNPWLEGADHGEWVARFVPQPFIPRRDSLEPDERVCLVVGPRQAGKSTLIWRTLADAPAGCLYLNCEEPSLQEYLVSPATFLADLEQLGPPVHTVFFDEIQHLAEAGLFLKGLVDRRTGKTIYATGSSSFDLESGTRESLAGRARRHLLLPLSIGEVAAVSGSGSLLERRREAEIALRHAVFGGYPVAVTGDEARIEVARLVEAFIIRDASDRFRIRHVPAFRRVLELMASQVGSLVNFSEWAAIAGIGNDTVADYVGLLEQTHVVRLIRPYVGGRRAELTRAPKAYFVDNGVRNQLFGGFAAYDGRADRGPLLENLVFSELSKILHPLLDVLNYWRSKSGAEVDFVIQHQGRLACVEAKAGDTRGRVTRSARSFIEAYSPTHLWVVTPVVHEELRIADTAVRFIPVQRLQAEIEEFLAE